MKKKEINQNGDKPMYFEEIKGDVNVFTNAKTTQLTLDEILDNFNSASVDLSSYNNKFGEKIHIERDETNKLYNWIIQDKELNKSPIAILAGNAGFGKSVILHDLLKKINDNRIPVLGIKADRLVIHKLDDLNNELGLDDNVESIFKTLSNTKKIFVLLIDQIDALSQSLSSDRSSLNTYHRLIQQLSLLSNIKIVISCRLYDLDYDPILQQYKKGEIFRVSSLTKEDVEKVLNELNISIQTQSNKLIEFLRIPLHLQLFCKINKPEKFSEAISLQTLYDEIWQEFILLKPNNINLDYNKVQELIEAISNQMYNNQCLVLNQKLFESKYKKELDYLSSEEILTKPEKSKIQFIHQSFFDYAYARTFIDNGNAISTSLKSIHQGLFVRSRVKQVFAYLRELDQNNYIKELDEILFGDYRFHLKLLLINSLGFYSDPSIEEKRFVQNKVFQNENFFKIFLESTYSQEWFRFLVKDIKIIDYFRNNNKEFIDIIYSLCMRIIYTCTEDVIDFLEEINKFEFDEKYRFVGNILTSIPEDKIHLSLLLYKECEKELYDYHIYQYFKKAIEKHPDFVIAELKKKVIDNFSIVNDNIRSDYIPGGYDATRVYEKLFERDREKATYFFIDLIKFIEDKTKQSYKNSEDRLDKIFYSPAYFFYVPLKKNNTYIHEKLYDFVLNYIDELFNTDFDKAKSIIIPLLESESAIIVNIPIFFMSKYPTHFKDISLEILCNEKFYLYASGILEFNLKELLKVSYPLFSQDEQISINKVIINLSPSWEKVNLFKEKGISHYGYTRIGYTAYTFLSMLPEEIRKNYSNVDTFFNEKNRKYGKVENVAPKGVTVKVGDSTMSKDAYEHMNNEQWINSFKTYVDDIRPFSDAPSRTGHCRAFEEYVSLNPERFISLINKIIFDNEVLPIYVVYGLQGLKKANYNPDKTKQLFVKFIEKRFLNKELDRESLQYSVWLIDYFIDNSMVDNNIIGFLTELVENYKDEEMLNNDPLLDGINRVRGAASLKLVQCYKFPEFKNDIFSALEKMASNAAVHTRAAALYQLAYLNHLDIERNRNLFLNLMKDNEHLLLKGSLYNLHPLLYFIHDDFSKLIEFFTNAINIEESHEIISHILFFAWLENFEKSEYLLNQILNKSDLAKLTVIKAAFDSIEQEVEFENRCWEILYRFLDIDQKEFGEVYENGFLRLEKNNFSDDMNNFLEKYVHSAVGKYRGFHFYSLLLKLSKDIPEKCIEWTLQFNEHKKPNIQERMLSNEPLQVVIQSYNAIREYDKTNPRLEEAMDAFDSMLTVPEYRGSAKEVLYKIDE